MPRIFVAGVLIVVLAFPGATPAAAQQYPQAAANQLMTLTAVGLVAQLCGVPMTDETRKTLSDGLERLGNSQTDIDEATYHQKVEEMAKTITGDLDHACIQINNQDVPSLIEKILGQ